MEKKETIFDVTITKLFIAPTLGIDSKHFEENGYVTAYSYESNEDKKYENVAYLVFKPKDLDKFNDFVESEHSRTHLLIDDYDYEGGFVVLVYKLPSKWEKDYELIRQGRYSETSEKFQNVIPKVKKFLDEKGLHKDEVSLQTRILKKSEDLVSFWEKRLGINFKPNMEAWYGWEIEKETLKKELL